VQSQRSRAQVLRALLFLTARYPRFFGAERGTFVAQAGALDGFSTFTASARAVLMTSVKQNLQEDHAQLECRLQRLANAVDANDSCADLRRIWAGFEANLLDHLGTEERCLFPMVVQEHRAEVEALRAEHQHIRCALTELGICVELHTLRKQAVDELIGFLRHHAAREDASLYEWVEKKSSPPLRGIFAMSDRYAARGDSEPPTERG
jgi:hemerythrin-like domain-containing protein